MEPSVLGHEATGHEATGHEANGHDDRLIQIFAMSTVEARDLAEGLLRALPDLVVEATTSGPDHFLIVESNAPEQAHSVWQLVQSCDEFAALTHRSHGTSAAGPALLV